MISGHVHLLSILSWGILVYQTSMPFFVALHFTTRVLFWKEFDYKIGLALSHVVLLQSVG